MSRGKRLPRGKALRAIWLCALALMVLAVLTTPLATSKYITWGEGQAKARIAAWEPVWGHGTDSLTSLSAGFVNPSGDKTVQMTMTNKSEVAIKCEYYKAWIRGVPAGSGGSYSQVEAVEPVSELNLPIGEFSHEGADILFETGDAGTVDTANVGSEITGDYGITVSPAERTVLAPNATGVQQTFTFQFTGLGAPGAQVNYISDPTAGNLSNPPSTWTPYAITDDFRAYRVNFECTVQQVD